MVIRQKRPLDFSAKPPLPIHLSFLTEYLEKVVLRCNCFYQFRHIYIFLVSKDSKNVSLCVTTFLIKFKIDIT